LVFRDNLPEGAVFFACEPQIAFQTNRVVLRLQLEPDAAGTFQCEDDIDFRVSGFRVSGHVDGAQGVKVVLHSARADRADVDAVADASGAFTFDNIAPGTYTAVAHHPTWTMDTTPQEISVGGGAAAFAKSFTVRGTRFRYVWAVLAATHWMCCCS